MQKEEYSKKLKFVVESLDDTSATLRYNETQSLTVPLEDLRGDIQEGDVLFAVFAETTEEKTAREMAKETLNELLGADEEQTKPDVE